MRFLPALLVLVAGCTDQFLELDQNVVALGEGLTGPYRPMVTTCDPGDVYPAGCDNNFVAVDSVKARGAIAVTVMGEAFFEATGSLEGEGEVEISAGGFDERIAIEVAPVAYSLLTWWGGQSAGPYAGFPPPRPDRQVFTNSRMELSQTHYRVSFEELANTFVSDRLDVVLYGHAKYELVPGGSEATLVELADRRAPLPFPRVVFQAGAVPGTVRITTEVGGELVVTMVDETAIARLADGYVTGEPIDQYSSVLDRFSVSPLDAQGKYIGGCPPVGPTVSDTAGILVATRWPEAESCQFRFELAAGKAWQDTTIVVTWNQAELRVPVDPS